MIDWDKVERDIFTIVNTKEIIDYFKKLIEDENEKYI